MFFFIVDLQFLIPNAHHARIAAGRGRGWLDHPGRRRWKNSSSSLHLRCLHFITLGNVDVNLDGLTLLEGEVQLGLRLLVLLGDLLLLPHPLKMVLEGDVEVEAVGSVGEAHPDEGASAPLIHDLDDEVSGAAGVNSECYK